jgi:hypothetical protein
MNGTVRSSCRVSLVTYQGAFVIIRSILDWLRCILAICDLLAHRLVVTPNVVPSSPILDTLIMETLRSSETSVLTRTTWHNIPEDTILHSHRRENLKSYTEINQ